MTMTITTEEIRVAEPETVITEQALPEIEAAAAGWIEEIRAAAREIEEAHAATAAEGMAGIEETHPRDLIYSRGRARSIRAIPVGLDPTDHRDPEAHIHAEAHHMRARMKASRGIPVGAWIPKLREGSTFSVRLTEEDHYRIHIVAWFGEGMHVDVDATTTTTVATAEAASRVLGAAGFACTSPAEIHRLARIGRERWEARGRV